ncbi:MAG: hypothetical protein WC292_04555 [Clostridia bacterium]
MRSLARQGRVFWAIMYLIISWMVFVLLFTAVYYPAIFKNKGIMGYNLQPYYGTSETQQIKKHSLIIARQTELDALEAGSVITYSTMRTDISPLTGREKNVYDMHTRIFVSYYKNSDGTITIYTNDIATGEEFIDQVSSSSFIGTNVTALPYLGAAIRLVTQGEIVMIATIIVLFALLVVLPVVIAVKSVKKFRRKSPFPEGLDTSKFKTHDLYIHSELIEFFKDGGLNIVKGFDCDKVYIGDSIYFANIAYINKTIYVNINKDLRRYDRKVDRSGAIPIVSPHDLEQAKDRIMYFYKLYFKPLRKKLEQRSPKF